MKYECIQKVLTARAYTGVNVSRLFPLSHHPAGSAGNGVFFSHLVGLNQCVFKTTFSKTKESNFLFLTKKGFTPPAKGNFHRSPLLLELQDLSLFPLSCIQKQRLTILYVFTECCYPKVTAEFFTRSQLMKAQYLAHKIYTTTAKVKRYFQYRHYYP